MIGVYIHLSCHVRSHRLRVARQHDDLVYTAAAQLVQRLFHLWTDRIIDANDTDELRIARHVEEILARHRRDEILLIRNAVLLQKAAASDADHAARKTLEIRHLGQHAARHNRLGGTMLRCFPRLLLHIFLNRHSERMNGVFLRRCRKQDDLLLRYALRGADERDLRHTDRQRPRLVKHNRIRTRKRLDVVAALDENAALRRRRNRCGHRCRGRQLEPA